MSTPSPHVWTTHLTCFGSRALPAPCRSPGCYPPEQTWKHLNNRVSSLLLEEEREEERALRAKQIANLQHHADQLVELQKRAVAAKARAAERAVERAAERKVRAKREMELVKRAEKAKVSALMGVHPGVCCMCRELGVFTVSLECLFCFWPVDTFLCFFGC